MDDAADPLADARSGSACPRAWSTSTATPWARCRRRCRGGRRRRAPAVGHGPDRDLERRRLVGRPGAGRGRHRPARRRRARPGAGRPTRRRSTCSSATWPRRRMRPGRGVVLTDPDSFPTDLYVTGRRGRAGRAGGSCAAPPEVPAVLARARRRGRPWSRCRRSTTAPASCGTCPAITRAAHGAGALALWDLCHSAGVVPVGGWTRTASTSPSAAATSTSTAAPAPRPSSTCGPAPPGRLRPAADRVERPRPPVRDGAPDFVPGAGIAGGRVGTPPLLSMLALEAALRRTTGWRWPRCGRSRCR